MSETPTIDELDERTRDLKTALDKLSESISTLKSASDQHTADLSELQQFRDHFTQNVDQRLEPKVKSLQAEIEKLRAELAQAQTDLRKAIEAAEKAAENAKTTLTEAVRTAQTTANNAVKGIKFFEVEASVRTDKVDSETTITFPERVDAVAIQSIMNDGHDMWRAVIARVSPTTFKVIFRSARGEGKLWIPAVRFLGIQVQR